jgi:hypothetical protein
MGREHGACPPQDFSPEPALSNAEGVETTDVDSVHEYKALSRTLILSTKSPTVISSHRREIPKRSSTYSRNGERPPVRSEFSPRDRFMREDGAAQACGPS